MSKQSKQKCHDRRTIARAEARKAAETQNKQTEQLLFRDETPEEAGTNNSHGLISRLLKTAAQAATSVPALVTYAVSNLPAVSANEKGMGISLLLPFNISSSIGEYALGLFCTRDDCDVYHRSPYYYDDFSQVVKLNTPSGYFAINLGKLELDQFPPADGSFGPESNWYQATTTSFNKNFISVWVNNATNPNVPEIISYANVIKHRFLDSDGPRRFSSSDIYGITLGVLFGAITIIPVGIYIGSSLWNKCKAAYNKLNEKTPLINDLPSNDIEENHSSSSNSENPQPRGPRL